MNTVPNSLHEVVRTDEFAVYFGNMRSVAENGDSSFFGCHWLVDLLIKPHDEPRAEIAFGWYAIRCVMDDFGELICSDFDFLAHEQESNILLWEFAIVVDGRIVADLTEW